MTAGLGAAFGLLLGVALEAALWVLVLVEGLLWPPGTLGGIFANDRITKPELGDLFFNMRAIMGIRL